MILKFAGVVLLSAICAALTAAVALSCAVLLSAGLLSAVIGAGSMTGLLGNVASDLHPSAMLLTGLCCLSAAVALACSLYITCPKAVRKLNMTMEKIFT